MKGFFDNDTHRKNHRRRRNTTLSPPPTAVLIQDHSGLYHSPDLIRAGTPTVPEQLIHTNKIKNVHVTNDETGANEPETGFKPRKV